MAVGIEELVTRNFCPYVLVRVQLDQQREERLGLGDDLDGG